MTLIDQFLPQNRPFKLNQLNTLFKNWLDLRETIAEYGNKYDFTDNTFAWDT